MTSKSILKKTREAIDSKNYAEALKLSKSVLKEDEDNYLGLVYAALASQELDAKTEAEAYFENAIKSSPTNNLAWQGLANFYDKCTEAPDVNITVVKKLLKTYCKLIELDSEDTKVIKILNKIDKPQLCKIAFNEVIATLSNLLLLDILSSEIKQMIKQLTLKHLCYKDQIPEEYNNLFENCYLNSNTEILTVKNHLTYLQMLYSKENINDLLKTLTNINHDVKNDSDFLDWQCKIFNETYILQNKNYTILYEGLQIHSNLLSASKLLNAQIAYIIIEILNEPNGMSLEIKDSLEKVTSTNPECIYAWIILSDIYIALQFYEEAIIASMSASKLLSVAGNMKFGTKVDRLVCYSYSKSQNEEYLLQVNEVGQKVLAGSINNLNILSCLVESNLKLNNFDLAKKHFEMMDKASCHYSVLKAMLFRQEGQPQKAIEILEEHIHDNTEYWILLGDLYWPDNLSKCLIAYLKATKSHPLSYICYQRLGRYYQHVSDLDKSKRCYEKSIKIKSTKAVCVELSKIYRKLQKWDENLSLLLTLTYGNITNENSWSYFQLGIHYYEREDFIHALKILRLVIRIDPDNCFCWECLGDCYFSAGSYTSALKCYQKVKTMNSQSLYPMLQIANIKKLLGEFVDAKTEFEYVLEIDASYIPALKGAAEVCYLLAKQHFFKQLYGLSRDTLQSSLNYISRALHVNASLSCGWKIAADCCYIVSKLPFKYSFLSVSGVINESNIHDDDSVLIVDELLKIAIRLYCKALSCNPDNIYIYHDLACSYAQYAILVDDTEEKEEFLNHALSIIQHCINGNATYSKHWNVLGNICFLLKNKKIQLSQHAFIKAVTLDRNDAISWTNLGTLYLYLEELKLANDVFSQAQKSNPNYVNCWIGQALIAEISDMEEAMDLFRHTMELSYHPEGTIGYASWVCKKLMAKRSNETIYAIDNMHAIPVACDGLRWYMENNPRDPCAWNMLGILCERLGIISDAKEAYTKSVKYSRKPEAYINLGRTYCTLKLYPESINCYAEILDTNVNAEIGYALTLFKDQDYESAYKVYENILEEKLENKDIQSDLLVALASMIYMFQGPEPAKHLLFQSTQLESRSPWSLYAVLSLGLLDEDFNLAELAFNEIEKLEINEENLKHYAKLLVYTFLIQGKYQTAISKLSTWIHKYPDSGSLWFELSALLYRIREVKSLNNVIVKCAQASLKLKGNDPNLSMVLPMVTATSILSGDLCNALKAAQRQVHYYPDNFSANKTLSFTLTRLISSK